MPLFYEPLEGNAMGFEATLQNMAHLQQHVQGDRLIRISDKGCFRATIVAETQRQGFDLIFSFTWIMPYPALVEQAWATGQTFTPCPLWGRIKPGRRTLPTGRAMRGWRGLTP